MKTTPKISIVMSLYNSGKYLREAIDSVLSQTLSDFEFIIIDDGSSDNGAAIVRSYDDSRIRLIIQENSGLAAALNKAIQLAKSKLIARMDPDDICFPERLSKQCEYLEQYPEVMALGSAAICIDLNGEVLPLISMKKHFEIGDQPMPESPCIHPSVIFRRSAFDKAGGYWNEMRFGGEDAVLFNEILSFGAIDNLPDPLIYYRLSPSSLSQKSKKFNAILREIIWNKVKGNQIEANGWVGLEQEYRSSERGDSAYHLYIAKLFLGAKGVGVNVKAREHLIKALQSNRSSLITWVYLASSYMPPAWRAILHSYFISYRSKVR